MSEEVETKEEETSEEEETTEEEETPEEEEAQTDDGEDDDEEKDDGGEDDETDDGEGDDEEKDDGGEDDETDDGEGDDEEKDDGGEDDETDDGEGDDEEKDDGGEDDETDDGEGDDEETKGFALPENTPKYVREHIEKLDRKNKSNDETIDSLANAYCPDGNYDELGNRMALAHQLWMGAGGTNDPAKLRAMSEQYKLRAREIDEKLGTGDGGETEAALRKYEDQLVEQGVEDKATIEAAREKRAADRRREKEAALQGAHQRDIAQSGQQQAVIVRRELESSMQNLFGENKKAYEVQKQAYEKMIANNIAAGMSEAAAVMAAKSAWDNSGRDLAAKLVRANHPSKPKRPPKGVGAGSGAAVGKAMGDIDKLDDDGFDIWAATATTDDLVRYARTPKGRKRLYPNMPERLKALADKAG